MAELAAGNGLAVHAPEEINHPLWLARIAGLEPDILFSFYYRSLLSEELLAIPKLGGYNLHGSLLPKYRGRCPVNWVLVNGEKETGVTLHRMTPRPDDGDIIGCRRVAIDAEETALSLHRKIAAAGKELLAELVPKLADGTAVATPQDESEASYYGGRTPADGEIEWSRPAAEVGNLVRAVTRPWPGAFSWLGDRRIFFWRVKAVDLPAEDVPGTIVNTSPLTIACGSGAVEVDFAESDEGLYSSAAQLVTELNMAVGMRLGARSTRRSPARKTQVLILGVNGFIGNHLSERLLASGRYEVYGMDLRCNTLTRLLANPDFHFTEGDISIQREWIEYHVRKCDIVLPLVAIATPIEYVRNPLRVFELDFEENLRVVRYCARYGKRLLFPSTSEVYGMCTDDEFDERSSNLVLGPIHKQRWIYSCSKQMLDRVIWAYGSGEGLPFTLFRPFNWIGPRLDSLESARIGSSRVITRFILNLVEGTPTRLVDGGTQKRCFTDVKDGVECLFRIIENRDDRCNAQIFNIGNPDNEYSMIELARILREKFDAHPRRSEFPPDAGLQYVEARAFYGRGYQDVQHRRPSITRARRLLGWEPQVSFEESVEQTLDYFLEDAVTAMREGR